MAQPSKSLQSRTSSSFNKRSATAASFTNWLSSEGYIQSWAIVFILIQAAYFSYSYYLIWNASNLKTFRTLLGHGLPIARSAANVINMNCAIILLAVCRNAITLIRSKILSNILPLESSIEFHKMTAWSIVFWSVVHVVAHFFNYNSVQLNFAELTAEKLNLTSGPGWTGQVITVALFLIVTASVEVVRKTKFEMFWFTHHLFLVFFGGILVHGSFCFIKGDNPEDVCRGGATFWKFWVASAICYFFERLYRVVRSRRMTYISKVVEHPSNVVEIQFEKPSMVFKAGQYLFICCPEISPFEWHPFTITSSPHETFVSIHMRVVGDWTRKFAKRLGCLNDGKNKNDNDIEYDTLPSVLIDGPFGSATENVFDYEAGVLIGAGIGVTPFASVLKTVWYRINDPESHIRLKKIYFVWICRDKQSFEWFQDLLSALEQENIDGFLHISTYLTQKFDLKDVKNILINQDKQQVDVITGLRSKTSFGRPNWDKLFNDLRVNHPGEDIGVFFCGPLAMSNAIRAVCDQVNRLEDSDTRFFFFKEQF